MYARIKAVENVRSSGIAPLVCREAAKPRIYLLKETLMRTLLIAAVAVAVSGAAFAKDLKGSVMSDAEMDKVTAGVSLGVFTALPASNGAVNGFTGIDGNPDNFHPPGSQVGSGVCTANRPGAPCG